MRVFSFFGISLLLANYGCARRGSSEKEETPSVKITQFYAAKPAIPKGETGLLCYGVQGATKVRVEPPVEQLSPALTRCFEVKPETTNTYTLVAEGRDGTTVRQTATIQVGAARPQLFDLSISKQKIKRGEEVAFCFQSRNATGVRGSPGKFARGGAPGKDCLIDRPEKTTTYTITVNNAQDLTDTASITVEVSP